MQHPWYVFAAFVAGIVLSVESAIGGVFGQSIGDLEASFYVFFVPLLLSLPYVLVRSRLQIKHAFTLPKHELGGGVLGALYVVLLFMSVTELGVGVAMALVLMGQLGVSMVIEHHGWAKVQKIPFNGDRFIALCLLAAALVLIV